MNSEEYDDIINMDHHVSESRHQMSMMGRAAQFAPFSALTGYGDSIAETARLTDKKIELSVDEQDKVSRRLIQAMENNLTVTVSYFKPDSRKKGGRYLTASGNLKKIDEYSAEIVMADGLRIPINDLLTIDF
ncbi:MAG: YolD-like family protein [Muribaculaceae bacterium]|nr:YolD-like family protein [Muribaculaceae bacterium]MDE6353090.1 YolD-like family protein [Muribaculaceae bacterium]MDE6643256.1 YolD-like family protein [Muribaculaceae bacterium]